MLWVVILILHGLPFGDELFPRPSLFVEWIYLMLSQDGHLRFVSFLEDDVFPIFIEASHQPICAEWDWNIYLTLIIIHISHSCGCFQE